MSTSCATHIVLVGIGHTNAHVLRMWYQHRPSGARLTCVSNHPVSTYSGMLPGVLAGEYRPEAMELDLPRLCRAAGADLVVGDVDRVDVAAQELLFADRAAVRFDVLSIGVGSVPSIEGLEIADASRLLAVKPMQTFLARLRERLQEAAGARAGAPLRVAVVGGGAGGVEVALCLPPYVRAVLGDAVPVDLTIINADERLLPGSLVSTSGRVQEILERRGGHVRSARRVVRVEAGGLRLDDDGFVDADVILWTTGAAPPPLLASVPLPKDQRGFLLTDDSLRSTGDAPVFVVGDSGTIEGRPAPKAGVYAVRQGPVLWDNLRRTVTGTALKRYTPQRGFLKLLNTGDGCAIGEWKGHSFEGRWCRWLKHFIDTRFVKQYRF